MVRTILISLFLLFPPFFPSLTTPLYGEAEEIVQEQIENFPKEEPAGESLEEETPPHQQVIDVRKLFFKTLLLLIAICGVVISGGYLLKRATGGKLSSFSTAGNIQLLERKYLSPKTSLWLVEVKNQPMVVVDSQYGIALQPLKERPSIEETKEPA